MRTEGPLKLRTVRLVIGFDGTRYEGWQSQLKGKTIQEAFEKVLERIFKTKTPIVSSSRTDSGVHAEGLVAHFHTQSKLPDSKIRAALNFYLDRDILVRSAETVGPRFHARYSAKSKIYRYRIWTSQVRPLFEAPYVLWHPHTLDIRPMREAARRLVGKHDFRAFRDKSGNEEKSTIRTIKRLSVEKKGPEIALTIQADGFLTHMVRIIAGTLIEVGRKRIPPAHVRDILRTGDRKLAGPTAKPHGLVLKEVLY